MGVACCDSSAAPPDTRMVPKKGVVAKKDPLEAGNMEIETGDNMQTGEFWVNGELVYRWMQDGVMQEEK